MADNTPTTGAVIYFYLVKLTPLGKMQTDAVIEKDHEDVSKYIRGLHGTCKLYSVPGPYDYISRVDGISGTEAIMVKHEIERKGFADAMLLPGYPHSKNQE